MGGLDPRGMMGMGALGEEKRNTLRTALRNLNKKYDEEEMDTAGIDNIMTTTDVNTAGGFTQQGFSLEDFFCQFFGICGDIDVAGTGSNPDDPEAPGENSGDDDVPDADTPGLYPAMTGNPDQEKEDPDERKP